VIFTAFTLFLFYFAHNIKECNNIMTGKLESNHFKPKLSEVRITSMYIIIISS